MSVFADDAGAIVTGESIENLLLNDKRDNEIFNNALNRVNLAQDESKAVRQVWLAGPGPNRIEKVLAETANPRLLACLRLADLARYLSPWLDVHNSFSISTEGYES